MIIEKIEWLDSFGAGPTWTIVENVSDDIQLNCLSVGCVVKETDKYVIVAPHFHGDLEIIEGERQVEASVSGEMAIPKCCIVSRSILYRSSNDLTPQD